MRCAGRGTTSSRLHDSRPRSRSTCTTRRVARRARLPAGDGTADPPLGGLGRSPARDAIRRTPGRRPPRPRTRSPARRLGPHPVSYTRRMADRGTFTARALLSAGRRAHGPERVSIGSSELTTHGVIVGMTGSGKTGLAIDLIEETLWPGSPCSCSTPRATWATSRSSSRISRLRASGRGCPRPRRMPPG